MASTTGRPGTAGMLWLAARQLQSRWFEGLLIVLGLALGVAVLAAGVSFLSYLQTMMRRQSTLITEMRAVTVRPKGIDWQSLFQENAPPAQPLEPQVLEPAQLTLEDLHEVRTSIPGADYVLIGLQAYEMRPVVAIDDRPVVGAQAPGAAPEPTLLTLQATTPDIFPFRALGLVAGSAFTWEDMDAARPVMVVSETLARRLFPGLEPGQVIGHSVTVGAPQASQKWTIVGVVKDDPLYAMSPGLAARGIAYVPASAAEPRGLPVRRSLGSIQVASEDPSQTARLMQNLQRHFDGKYGAGRVQVDSPLAQLETVTRSQRAFMTAVILLTSLGLAIAAVNVLNLYTARVIRRRRLLGLSAALGASRRMLFWQMLSEALALGAVGSALGLVLAVPLLRGLHGTLFASSPEMIRALDMPAMGLSVSGALAGLGAGMVASVLFGAYPAWQGSRVSPAEVLRVE